MKTENSPAEMFLDMFNGSDWKARKRFLEYKPRLGLSIMETFTVSLDRLRRHQHAAPKLLELLAFLSGKNLNFRKFLSLERPWLTNIENELPDYEVFDRGLSGQSEYLAELENVSIGFRPTLTSPLQLHPLWIECVHQRAGHEGRVRWLRQIFLLCYLSWIHDGEETLDELRPFVENAIWVAAKFRIDSDKVFASQDFSDWIYSLNESDNDQSAEPASSSDSDDSTRSVDLRSSKGANQSPKTTSEVAQPANISGISKNKGPARRMAPEPPRLVNNNNVPGSVPQVRLAMSSLLSNCSQEAENVSTTHTTDEAFSAQMMRYRTLLGRLRSLEDENEQECIADTETARMHLEVYDGLIAVAPHFWRQNPLIEQILQNRKELMRSKMEI